MLPNDTQNALSLFPKKINSIARQPVQQGFHALLTHPVAAHSNEV
jgi:hypothetical protein